MRGEINKRQWIIFDGDVDPEWVENLNSVLDDNKVGSGLGSFQVVLSDSVRCMFWLIQIHEID